MLFNLFRKKELKPIHRFEDIVFISQPAKQAAVIAFAKQEPGFIFIAWFETTALLFRELFALYDLDAARIEEAKNFTAAKYTGRQIAFLERYPLCAKEEALVQNCSQQNFTVYNSLTEPLLEYFGSERLIPVMKKMGYSENEPIRHAMVTRALKRVQQKIAKELNLEQTAGSQEEWMRRNVRFKKRGS